ncbi:MAG: hypothetical protein ACTSSG_07965 [Candidatus Heimdallarchaeaceae archaeon]
MNPDNALEEMNILIGKMDKSLRTLNNELDKILKKYPRYLDEDASKLSYELYKFNHGK